MPSEQRDGPDACKHVAKVSHRAPRGEIVTMRPFASNVDVEREAQRIEHARQRLVAEIRVQRIAGGAPIGDVNRHVVPSLDHRDGFVEREIAEHEQAARESGVPSGVDGVVVIAPVGRHSRKHPGRARRPCRALGAARAATPTAPSATTTIVPCDCVVGTHDEPRADVLNRRVVGANAKRPRRVVPHDEVRLRR